MPELAEQMYCSQQICIPPTFPYLLRQFAKAAIRTQPNDLLKWATAYFRCLSLNIPPPVKPRLEYPIPKDHYGMTPGWLKALLYQFQGSQTVSFKVLWDRWIGACLQHPNLIQILCLGGFDDNTAVPWLKFIALCAAHLTENLTQTMILICEILTEEPEGGSAMIPVGVFLDLYQFLAQIDASIAQTLKNYYFLDKFLELYQEKIARDAGPKEIEETSGEASLSEASSEMTMKTEKETRKEDGASIISCPSVTSQDPDNFMKLLMKIQENDIEGEAEEAESKKSSVEEPISKKDEEQIKTNLEAKADEDDEKSDEEQLEAPEPKEESKKSSRKSETEDLQVKQTTQPSDYDEVASRDTKISTEKEDFLKLPDEHQSVQQQDEDEEKNKCLLEDLERLKLMQEQLMGGESDDELEKFKASILAEAAMTGSQLGAVDHFETKIDELGSESITESVRSDVSSVDEPPLKEKSDEMEYEEVFVEAVPGIGPKVPKDLVTAVCKFMVEQAKLQHNMVMPRNIRHFECPPLEITDY